MTRRDWQILVATFLFGAFGIACIGVIGLRGMQQEPIVLPPFEVPRFTPPPLPRFDAPPAAVAQASRPKRVARVHHAPMTQPPHVVTECGGDVLCGLIVDR